MKTTNDIRVAMGWDEWSGRPSEPGGRRCRYRVNDGGSPSEYPFQRAARDGSWHCSGDYAPGSPPYTSVERKPAPATLAECTRAASGHTQAQFKRLHAGGVLCWGTSLTEMCVSHLAESDWLYRVNRGEWVSPNGEVDA